ncbi:NADH-quinone oxidoreductase subunit J [Streptomyces sp. NBC_01218]|uniref:NADH-quinone oxidoreductase subunit J family protein n=1 Tax=Streptomyces sp. NBC_01218 TaxID=2903780 RepID=UPI002E0DDA45|nr:NADH-quinone oxidoreductase subunit J [Streptomyces sp. NBC_01218]
MTPAAASAAAHPGFLSPSGIEIAFVLVGLVTLGAALVTVTTRQLVHAALWLVVALGGLAVEYLLLTAEFIAWVQVLIYVGSVVVLLLFGLMLTRAPIGRSPDADSENRPVALAVAVAAAAALVWVVVDAFRTTWIDLDGPVQGSTAATGTFLFRHWVLPFEALSVLLLAALVGAIVLSRRDPEHRFALPAARRTPGRRAPGSGRTRTGTPEAAGDRAPTGTRTPTAARATGRTRAGHDSAGAPSAGPTAPGAGHGPDAPEEGKS